MNYGSQKTSQGSGFHNVTEELNNTSYAAKVAERTGDFMLSLTHLCPSACVPPLLLFDKQHNLSHALTCVVLSFRKVLSMHSANELL